MKNKALLFHNSDLSVEALKQSVENWFLDGEMRKLSKATLTNCRLYCSNLIWFLKEKGYASCGSKELRAFFAYLTNGHESEAGRWDNSRFKSKNSPSTINTYFRAIATLFRFIVEEGELETSPMDSLKPPVVRADQIQPFTAEQIDALLKAAKLSRFPKRDAAVILFFLDTGARASEVAALKRKNIDLQTRSYRVMGKGGKVRTIYYGQNTRKALWNYFQTCEGDDESPLFAGEGGTDPGGPITRFGFRQIFARLGQAAGIETARCSPHTFRHTFAIEFLRAGGNVPALQLLLGHSDIKMTMKYVALAQADLENQHRKFSPGDRLRRKDP